MFGTSSDTRNYEELDKRSLIYFIQEEWSHRLRVGYNNPSKYKISDNFINKLFNIYRRKGGKRSLESIKNSAL